MTSTISESYLSYALENFAAAHLQLRGSNEHLRFPYYSQNCWQKEYVVVVCCESGKYHINPSMKQPTCRCKIGDLVGHQTVSWSFPLIT